MEMDTCEVVPYPHTPLGSRELGDCMLGCALKFLHAWQLLMTVLRDGSWLHMTSGCVFVGTYRHKNASRLFAAVGISVP